MLLFWVCLSKRKCLKYFGRSTISQLMGDCSSFSNQLITSLPQNEQKKKRKVLWLLPLFLLLHCHQMSRLPDPLEDLFEKGLESGRRVDRWWSESNSFQISVLTRLDFLTDNTFQIRPWTKSCSNTLNRRRRLHSLLDSVFRLLPYSSPLWIGKAI